MPLTKPRAYQISDLDFKQSVRVVSLTNVTLDCSAPATAVKIGGDKETTASADYADARAAGVITTNPAFLMNKDLTDEYIADVAPTGRVPCKVVGKIEKGDLITTSDITGVVTALLFQDFVPGCIIGKALENYHSNAIGIIEVLAG